MNLRLITISTIIIITITTIVITITTIIIIIIRGNNLSNLRMDS